MDPFSAAAAVVAIIAPLLRVVGRSAADAAARRAGEAVGDAAVRGAAGLWHRVLPTLRSQPDADQALRRLAVDPDDASARALIGGLVGGLLRNDPQLLREALAVVDARDQHVAATVTVQGDGNATAVGAYSVAVSGSKGVFLRR